MPKHTRLQRRTAGYYLRVRVPDDVRPIIGKREVVRALGTTDYAIALTRVRLQAVEADKLFAHARRAPRAGAIMPVAAVPMATGRRKASTADVERALAAWFSGQTALDRQVALTALDDGARHEALTGLAAHDDGATVHATLERALATANLRLPSDAAVLAHGYQLARLVLDALVSADQAILEGTRRPGPVDLPWTPSAPLNDPGHRPKTKITELIDLWSARREKPNAKTKDTYARRAKAFADFLGHDDAGRVTTADVRRWLASLRAAGLAAKTINDGYLAAVKSLFQAAVLDDPPRIDTNPANGRGIALIEDKTKPRSRRPYTDDEAATIIKAARQEDAPHDRWLPILMAYTGARISELAQLLQSDVHSSAIIPYLSVDTDDDETKSIKNAPSRRHVPIHPTLIKEGFLKFVATVPKGEPIFGGLPVGTYGRRGDAASKRYGRFARALGIKDKRAVGHSWRHRLEDALREIDAPREVRDAILGHSTPGQGSDYGSGVSLRLKAKWLGKVK